MADTPIATPVRGVSAVILAGGLGTRMLPLSARCPKHLLEVAGEPVLVHQLRWLRQHGVEDVVLATGHLAGAIEAVLGDGALWGVRLRYSAERHPLGTGGALTHACRLLPATDPSGAVVVLNGDLLTDHDLTAQLEVAQGTSSESGVAADAVLHLRVVEDPTPYGSVVADERGHVVAFVEKGPPVATREINGGTYVFSRRAIGSVPQGVASLEEDILPRLVASGGVRAYREQAFWFDIGTPEALLQASCAQVLELGLAAWCDPTAQIDPTAEVSGGSAVGPGVTIGANCTVFASVVMAGATLGAGAYLRHAVLGPGATVPGGIRVTHEALA